MKITEALLVLFLVLFCYLFLDKFLFRGELGEICFLLFFNNSKITFCM